MAVEWIKWVKGLAKRPEVLQMAHILNKSRHEVAGLLCEFWEWADENVSVSEEDSASAICPGFVRIASASNTLVDTLSGADGFAEAMTAVGWLIVRDGSLEFPKFGRHNGKSAKRRALDAERKRTTRAESPDSVRDLSASQADKKKTRGEEKREKDSSSKNPSGVFVKPTVEEVAAYCRERKNSIDPEAFVAHYQSNGWMVGKSKMKDWKSAVITWEKNERARNPERRDGPRPNPSRVEPGSGDYDPAKLKRLKVSGMVEGTRADPLPGQEAES